MLAESGQTSGLAVSAAGSGPASRRLPFWRIATWVLLLAGLLLLGRDSYNGAKDRLGAFLIRSAFEQSVQDGEVHHPWSWADTYPVAELSAPRLGIRRHVLAGAGDSTLGWGLGHVSGTQPLGEAGVAVIAGHRDQEFRFLERIELGDRFDLRTPTGLRSYRVISQSIHHHDDVRVLANEGPSRLRLVTCYPIRGLRPTPLRWVLSLEPIDDPAEAHLDVTERSKRSKPDSPWEARLAHGDYDSSIR